MFAILLLCLVPADMPTEASSETQLEQPTIITGRLGFVDQGKQEIHVYCGGVEKIIHFPDERTRIIINGIGGRTVDNIGKLRDLYEHTITFKKGPGSSAWSEITVVTNPKRLR